MIVPKPWFSTAIWSNPNPCHNSSVRNGRNGCNSRSVLLRTKSKTANVLVLSARLLDLNETFVASKYQSQKSPQKNPKSASNEPPNSYSLRCSETILITESRP